MTPTRERLRQLLIQTLTGEVERLVDLILDTIEADAPNWNSQRRDEGEELANDPVFQASLAEVTELMKLKLTTEELQGRGWKVVRNKREETP